MLVAQTKLEKLVLMSNDGVFAKYGVAVYSARIIAHRVQPTREVATTIWSRVSVPWAASVT